MLADYAVDASRGRRYPEVAHSYREEFQRDRDRVIHSRAFRRLENKTQVFTKRFSDHFRNRLTHTIEVAQISRTIAAELGLNIDLVETLALVHDLGHPPFGHAGEKALNQCMRQHGEFFEHNLHALRIVEYFELRYVEFRGLNLTFEVREGIIKHSRDYDAKRYPKLSEYLLEKCPPLEAQLIDLADEIAYSTADLDDGLEAKILTLKTIRQGVPIFERYFLEVERKYPAALEKLKFNAALRDMFNALVGDFITSTKTRIAEAKIKTIEDVREHPQRLAAFSCEIEKERNQVKQFLYDRLYYSPELKADKANSEKVITELFHFWMQNPSQLPDAYRREAETESLVRVVCDYIAGMTDNFVLQQHARYFGV